ncbi:hypothetical protein [Ligilactobacillus aviarius]|uniref:Uncharacterized protein n=1 Tax=Ligilactobacillus aviarius TaxID=1606 RepID=A0A510WWH9_9LACO|nr:hypothetical protein [Ligilactobacillus aviarius]GEK42335.1 hypothetical protein LAV01_11670 [Ligilactobacillus aviarius]
MDKLWWIFQIILIILKLMHIITVSWLIVFLPVVISVSEMVATFILVLVKVWLDE